jgi:hypothetical protein
MFIVSFCYIHICVPPFRVGCPMYNNNKSFSRLYTSLIYEQGHIIELIKQLKIIQ